MTVDGGGRDPRLQRNLALLCGLRAMQMALFPMAILSVFLVRQVDFGVTEIMLLQGVFGVAMLVFEFPSGYLADRIGYRRCLIIAFVLWTIAWPIYGYATSWAQVATAELLLGVGMAMISGCDSALLYETLIADGREQEFARWSGRQTFWGQLAEGSAALVAGLLFAIAVHLPFLAQGLASAVGLVLALALVEPTRERPGFGDSVAQIKSMLRHVARDNPELRAVFVATIVLGLASFVPVWTIQLYAVGAGMPEPWLGPMWAIANFLVAIAALLSHRLFGSRSAALITAVCTGLLVAGYLGLGLVHTLWGVGFYYCLTAMRGLQHPVLSHREQRLVPSRDRAGFISLRSMVFRLGFLAVGPAVGWAVDQRGQHDVMLALAIGFGLAGLVAAWLLRRAEPASPPTLLAPPTGPRGPAGGPRSASG
ncbi:MFS transporter [Enhygromyxa salina]|uniref:Galactoside permease n=1 Tax=Enhygromyxa salina TaxID=215803 RepID=A0A2S9YWM7_9BACT|nr:MFS transporter [Enhygromyxa salina]PRQ09484.1 galactoside permease [Enhygromyxa salina]